MLANLAKSLRRESVQQNVDDDIVIQPYIFTKKRGNYKKLVRMAMRANGSLVFGRRRGRQLRGPWKLL
jgi:hypothetical protein